MDSQQTNVSDQQDEPNDVLPPVQTPVVDDEAGTDVSTASTSASVPLGVPSLDLASEPLPNGSQQTIPDSRALVPVPEEAGDNDIIEKEWVLKAKQIVEHTAEDPYLQQEELSKMKASYMKKRYNKDLGKSPI